MKIKKLTATQTLSTGFAAIILLGGIALSLPVSARTGIGLPFLDALFTSVSATCVTGLVLYDTWTQFSVFGQFVILLLIQIGGLGFMAIAILFSLAIGRRIGLRERSLLAEAISAMQLGGVIRLVRRMLFVTAVFELVGAVALSLRFVPLFGLWRGIWFSVFHSVSAFCNAGFDLMGCLQPFSSLTNFVGDPVVSLTVCILIISGGIGFVVWHDLMESHFKPKSCKLHTRAVLSATAILLALGTGLFLLLEKNGVLSQMTASEQILAAFFQSVTPRTAGFNTIDTAALSEAGKLITMLLMFVGAAPGGTGGGIKISTLVVIAAAIAASLRNDADVSLGNFRLEKETLQRAFNTAAIYIALTFAGVYILCVQGHAMTDAVFEALSAIGTVGLSTGITPSLPTLSKIAIMVLMYTGRVGSLTVFLAVARSRKTGKLRNPTGSIIVG